MTNFEEFLKWYNQQKITSNTINKLKPKYQWFVNIWTKKSNIVTAHLKYFEYFNIQTDNKRRTF